MEKRAIEEEENKILSNLENEFGIPEGFLTGIIALEKTHLFQLKRRNVVKKIEDMITSYAQD